jgi:hypothetical protein
MKYILILVSTLMSMNALGASSDWENGKTKCTPSFKNEKILMGYICPQIEEGSPFQKIGLLKNDLILKINEEPMDAETDHSVLQLQCFKNYPRGAFVVSRNGKPETLKAPLPFDRAKGYPRDCAVQ